MEIINHNNLTIKISQDDHPFDPREFQENVGTMVCWHRHYTLGDEQPKCTPDEYLTQLMIDREYRLHKRWVPEDIDLKHVQAYINKHFFVLMLYLYDHSGITMSTAPFHCPWDSGRVGFIYTERTCTEYPDLRAGLTAEVETYDQYLTGDVYQYIIEDDEGNCIDSCCNFYGFDECKQAAIESAQAIDQQLSVSYCI